MENFILCDNEGLQTGIDLALKPGEMVIYNMVDGKPVVLARNVDGGDWKFENDVYPAYVTEVNSTFSHEEWHRSIVRCVFEVNHAFELLKLPIVNVVPVARAPETVELGIGTVNDIGQLWLDGEFMGFRDNLAPGKWKITATRVG